MLAELRCDKFILCFMISHKFSIPLFAFVGDLLVFVAVLLFLCGLFVVAFELLELLLLVQGEGVLVENSRKKQRCTTASIVKF